MKALLMVLAVGVLLTGAVTASPIYDAVADFALSNPNGVWSYGYETTLGGTFNAYTASTTAFGGFSFLSAWYAPLSTAAPDLPAVIRNTSGSTQSWATIVQPADMLDLHPGQFGELTVVRFTAPATSVYRFSGLFQGIDTGGTTTGVYTEVNGLPDGSANINGFGQQAPFTDLLTLSSGDTVDFLVDYGTNGNFFNDSTGLQLTVGQVPEPATWTLLVAGLGLCGGFARRRR